MSVRREADVAAEVEGVKRLSRDELVRRWHKIYGVMPPKGIRQQLMVRAVAWHLQAKRLGGYSAETRRLLRSAISKVERDLLARNKRRMATSVGEGKSSDDDPTASVTLSETTSDQQRRQRRQLSPGARLIREWGGRTYVVDVIEGGYVFEAKVHKSLTAIAVKITGAHWSGPRFFGL